VTEAEQLYHQLCQARIDREKAHRLAQRLIENKRRIDEKYSVNTKENPFFLSDVRS
jgi:hypothetical protein